LGRERRDPQMTQMTQIGPNYSGNGATADTTTSN
jgi:hypothetical protein